MTLDHMVKCRIVWGEMLRILQIPYILAYKTHFWSSKFHFGEGGASYMRILKRSEKIFSQRPLRSVRVRTQISENQTTILSIRIMLLKKGINEYLAHIDRPTKNTLIATKIPFDSSKKFIIKL